MNAQERLEEIERRTDQLKNISQEVITWQGWQKTYSVFEDDYKYLIEQARRVEEQQQENKDMHKYVTNIGRENALLLEEVERLSAMDGIAIQLEKAQQEIERLKNYCWKSANFVNQVELEKEKYRLQSAIKQCKETLEKIAFDADVQFFEEWIDLAKEQIERLNEVERK